MSMNGRKEKSWKNFLLYSPAILAFLIMIPRLASPQFGLLDDATNIYATQQFHNGDLSWIQGLNSGRFRPAYFLIFALFYAIADMNPLAYFVIDSIIFILITCSLIFIVNHQSQNKGIAWWSGTLFVLSSPVIENFYTVYKQEALQIALLVGALLLTCQLNKVSSRLKRTVLLALSLLFILSALSFKETSLIIIPIAISWYIGAFVFQRITKKDTHALIKRNYMLITLCSGLIFILLWYLNKQNVIAVEGIHFRYSFEPSSIAHSLKEWERWIRRDFFFLYFLLVPPLLWFVHKRRFPHSNLFFDAVLWMIGWLAVFIPWVYQLDYYLLPFALGSSVLGAICISQSISTFRNGGPLYRIVAIASLCLAAFFFLTTLPNNLTNARLQLTIDKHNADLVAFAVDELPENAALLINIQQQSEYLGTLSRFINVLYDRSDIQIRQLKADDLSLAEIDDDHYYIATPIFESQFYRSVRLGFSADDAKQWSESISSYLDGTEEMVFETIGNFRLFLVEIRLGCLLRDVPSYCDIPTVPLDRRELIYGWRVYRIPIQQ